MTQIVPATAVLGPGKTGLTVGYRVLNLDGTQFAAFSTSGVSETAIAGTYRKASGVPVPDDGGYIVWGVSGTDYAEATVLSTSVNVTMWKSVTAPDNTGDAYARLGAPAGASVSADVAALHNFDPAVDTVKLDAAQGAVTFGQVKILANVADEGALHVVNNHADGFGQYNYGTTGQYNYGNTTGQYNEGSTIGQQNQGNTTGQYNEGNTRGQYNYGTMGQHNYGITTGQQNQGSTTGQYNYGSSHAGQYNYGTVTPVSGVDAVGIRAAVGLASSNLDTQLSGISTNVSTVLARLGAWAGTGINNVLGALRAMMRADATTPSDIGGTYSPATDSLEALAAGGGGSINPQDVADAMALATAETPAAGSVLARLAAIQVVTDAIDASAVTTAPSNNAGHLTIVAALTYRMTASGLVIPADWKRAYFTLKTSTLLPDDAAIVQVLVSNPAAGSDGLLRINKAAPSGGLDNTRATLTINQAAGTATLWIDDDATRLLSDGSMTWDVKFIDANGHSAGARGTAVVITTETLTT